MPERIDLGPVRGAVHKWLSFGMLQPVADVLVINVDPGLAGYEYGRLEPLYQQMYYLRLPRIRILRLSWEPTANDAGETSLGPHCYIRVIRGWFLFPVVDS